jgi:outer membrane protein TolC
LPSSLLEQRPDIRQAEARLMAANARVGEAKAMFFPSLSLTAFFGGISTSLSDVVTGRAPTSFRSARTCCCRCLPAGSSTSIAKPRRPGSIRR